MGTCNWPWAATPLTRAVGWLLQSGGGLRGRGLGPGCLAAAQRARYGDEDKSIDKSLIPKGFAEGAADRFERKSRWRGTWQGHR